MSTSDAYMVVSCEPSMCLYVATYRNIVKLRETAASATDAAEGNTLVENETVLVLLLQLDLFVRWATIERVAETR